MIDPRDPRFNRAGYPAMLPGYVNQGASAASAPLPGGRPGDPGGPGPAPNPAPPVPGGPGPNPTPRLPIDPGVIIPGATPGAAPGGRPQQAPPTDGYYGGDYAWRQATGQNQWFVPPAGAPGGNPPPRVPVDPTGGAPGPGGPGPRQPILPGPGGPPVRQAGDVGQFGMTVSPSAQSVALPAAVASAPVASPAPASGGTDGLALVPPQIQAERAQRRPQAAVQDQATPPPPAAPVAPVQRPAATGVAAPIAQPQAFQPTAPAPVIAAPQPGRIPNGNVGY